jgi:nucleoside-diphosphate-sugar epimerase
MPQPVDEAASGNPWGLPLSDIDEGVVRASSDLVGLSGARVLVTGGTGFLGSWLLTSLIRANATLDLGLDLVVLSRQPSSVPLHDDPSVSLIQGDVRSLAGLGEFHIVVHGAAVSSATYGRGDSEPMAMISTIVDGTKAVLDAVSARRARLLLLSSGAVYGPQTHSVEEGSPVTLDSMDWRSAYGQAKRMAETLCSTATQAGDVDAVVGRLFAFVGPRIPLDSHFAAGNFLRDALHRRPIVVKGDGRPRRSYLYVGDLPEWCWGLVARGQSASAYNVGSPEAVTIEELARMTAELASPAVDVSILGEASSGPAAWYVPSTDRARTELGLEPRTPLHEALAKTLRWLELQAGSAN